MSSIKDMSPTVLSKSISSFVNHYMLHTTSVIDSTCCLITIPEVHYTIVSLDMISSSESVRDT